MRIVTMKTYKAVTLFLIAVISLHITLLAQTNASVRITNLENKTTIFSLADLNALPQTTLIIKGEDGIMHNYSGIDINVLLAKAAVPLGPAERKQVLNSYLLIKAADNYSIIYALAEIDSFFSDKKVILADMKDAKPIPAQFGPLQIISTNEKVHARLIRMVTDIIIRKAQ